MKSIICSKMDSGGGHHVEGNKLVPERQRSRVLPYLWEVEFKKQTKGKKSCYKSSFVEHFLLSLVTPGGR